MTNMVMTNKDKYLKDGISEYDFLNFVFNEGNIGWNGEEDYCYIKKLDLLHLLQQPVKPTLTEDEKVILRNIDTKNFYPIGRINDYLYLKGDSCYGFEDGKDKDVFWYLYHNLFHFIQNGEEYSIKELLGDDE